MADFLPWPTVIEEGNGQRHRGRHPFLPLPLNRPGEIKLCGRCLLEGKTSLRAACPRPSPPSRWLQTTATPLPPPRFTLQDATQRLAAQGTTEMPPRARRIPGKQHVTAWPVARTMRTFWHFVGWALTHAGQAVAPGTCSCRARPSGQSSSGRWPLLAAPPITPCLLLAVLSAVVTGPIRLLRMPAPPTACRFTAGGRAVTTLGVSWLKPLATVFEQATAPAAPRRPIRLARQCPRVHGSVDSRGSSLGEEPITPLRGVLTTTRSGWDPEPTDSVTDNGCTRRARRAKLARPAAKHTPIKWPPEMKEMAQTEMQVDTSIPVRPEGDPAAVHDQSSAPSENQRASLAAFSRARCFWWACCSAFATWWPQAWCADGAADLKAALARA